MQIVRRVRIGVGGVQGFDGVQEEGAFFERMVQGGAEVRPVAAAVDVDGLDGGNEGRAWASSSRTCRWAGVRT